MKIFQILMAFFCAAAIIVAQNPQPETANDNYRLIGKFYINDSQERILAYDLRDGGKKLRLIGETSIQFWDLETQKPIESFKHEIADLGRILLFNPDKSQFVVASYEKKNPIKDAPKIRIPAGIYAADTGKLIKTLEGAQRPVEAAMWSANGQTLMTASGFLFSTGLGESEISFWDAATLERRASVIMGNVTWDYLTPDGNRFLTTSGEKRSLLGFGYASEKTEIINVWNARDGKLEKQFAIGDENFFARANKLKVSPDGETFAYVLKNRKKGAEDKLVVRAVADAPTDAPRYEIKANPKIAESRLEYSPDGELVSLDAGKNVQIYQLATGVKKSELTNFNSPNYWFDDNRIALYDRLHEIQAVETATGKSIFVEPVIYKTHTEETNCTYDYQKSTSNCTTETVIDDFTRIQPNSDGKTFLIYSNQLLKIYDVTTGKIKQTLVAPPTPVLVKRKKILGIFGGNYYDYGPKLIDRAGWSEDFQQILIHDAGEKSVTIWAAKN